jgi:hypothetical protein
VLNTSRSSFFNYWLNETSKIVLFLSLRYDRSNLLIDMGLLCRSFLSSRNDNNDLVGEGFMPSQKTSMTKVRVILISGYRVLRKTGGDKPRTLRKRWSKRLSRPNFLIDMGLLCRSFLSFRNDNNNLEFFGQALTELRLIGVTHNSIYDTAILCRFMTVIAS